MTVTNMESGSEPGGTAVGLLIPGLGASGAASAQWDPPRDIKINLFPLRQNLIANPVGLGGTFGWDVTNGTLSPVTGPITPPWPAEVSSGFQVDLTLPGYGSGDYGDGEYNVGLFTPEYSGGSATQYGSGGFNVSTFGTVDSSWMISSMVPVNAGLPYSFSVYLTPMTSGILVTYTVGITFYSVTQEVLSTVVSTVTSSGGFVRGGVSNQVAPAGATTAAAQVVILSPTEQHYFTAALFEPSSAIGVYFDANFSPAADYTFEGTPNESISDFYPNLAVKLSRLREVMVDYIPIGSTFSLVTGAQAFANIGQNA